MKPDYEKHAEEVLRRFGIGSKPTSQPQPDPPRIVIIDSPRDCVLFIDMSRLPTPPTPRA